MTIEITWYSALCDFGKGLCPTLVAFFNDFGPIEYANNFKAGSKLHYIIILKGGSKSDDSSVNLS